MSIMSKSMTYRAAFAVKRRLEKAHPKSTFEMFGSGEARWIREVRPGRTRTGHEYDEIIVHGREVTRHVRVA